MRKPIERTSIITSGMYALLIDCCEEYYENLAWVFPDQCPDGHGCCGLDYSKFSNNLKYDIPNLYRDSNNRIAKPAHRCLGTTLDECDPYDQYALLDFIEYIGQHCRDISIGEFHGYFGHNHIDLLETDIVFGNYRVGINSIFEKTGLLYTLTTDKIVERVAENSVLSAELENVIKAIKEPGIKELLEDAIFLFKQPEPITRKIAVEKIWDAFERLKTYYKTLDKKASAERIVNEISNGKKEYAELFNDEFTALTKSETILEYATMKLTKLTSQTVGIATIFLIVVYLRFHWRFSICNEASIADYHRSQRHTEFAHRSVVMHFAVEKEEGGINAPECTAGW